MMMFARSRQLLAAAAESVSKTISLSELNTRPVRTATQHRRPKRGGVKDADLVRNWNILAGDQVMVIAGDAKGEKGIVKRVIRKKNMVIVENVNMNTRIFKPNPEIRGRKYKREGLLHVSNVMLVDPKSKTPTRVKSIFTSAGRKLRVSKSSDIVIPRNNSRLIPDRKTRYAPEPSPFDTDPAAAAAVTYKVRGEANGVDPLRIQRLKAKKLPLPATYRAPLRTAGQVWAIRVENKARERASRQQSKADRAAYELLKNATEADLGSAATIVAADSAASKPSKPATL